MLDVVFSNQFKRDLRLARRRGYDLDLLDETVGKLTNREPLPQKNQDHALSGNYAGFRKCHVQPDWLLVYRIDEEEAYVFLSRTGTHSDLF